MTTIQAHNREKKSKIQALRERGLIPAVMYSKGEITREVTIDKIDFLKVFKDAGETQIIQVVCDDKTVHDALVQDIQFDPVSEAPLHVDFLKVSATEFIEVSIPLEYIGEAPALLLRPDAQVTKVLHEVEVESLPRNLPTHIEVDLALLPEIESNILAGMLILPANVKLVTDPEEVVATITITQEEKEEENTVIDFSSIEVEKKGKKDVDGIEA